MNEDSLDYFVGEVSQEISYEPINNNEKSSVKQKSNGSCNFSSPLLGVTVAAHMTPIIADAYFAGRYERCSFPTQAKIGTTLAFGLLALEGYLLYHNRESLGPALALFPLWANLISGAGVMIQRYVDRSLEQKLESVQ